MPAEDTIRILHARGAQAGELDAPQFKRTAARVAWVRETIAKLRAAQRRVDQAWERMLNSSPEFPGEGDHAQHGGGGRPFEDCSNDQDLPTPPEQSELDAIHAELRAVIDEDRWPRQMHFKGI